MNKMRGDLIDFNACRSQIDVLNGHSKDIDSIPFDVWTSGDLTVKSLQEAQAVVDDDEKIQQIILWEKYGDSSAWRGYFENEGGEKYVKLDPIEVSPVLRAVSENTCRLTARNVKCENCGEYNTIPICDRGKVHKRVCPGCSQNEASRRALKAAHMIYRFTWKALGFCEVTTPSDWLEPDRVNDVEYVNQRYDDFMVGVQKFLKESFPGHPAVVTFHHWHSTSPMGCPHFHAHIEFSWTPYESGRIGKPGDFYIPKDNNEYADRLARGEGRERRVRIYDQDKRMWLNHPLTLEFLRGRVAHFLKIPENNGQFYYQFQLRGFDEESRAMAWRSLVHRLSYVFRGYVQDVNEWLFRAEKDGEFPGAENWDWFKWHLRIKYYQQNDDGTSYLVGDWKRRTRYLGAWHSTQVNKWIVWGTEKCPETGLLAYYDHLEQASKLYCWNCKMELDLDPIALSKCDVVTFEKSAAPYKLIIDRPPPWALLRIDRRV